MIRVVVVVAFWFASGTASAAQSLDGYFAVMVDAVPNQDATELRARLFAERRVDMTEHLRIIVAGFAEGLIADRSEPDMTTAALLRPQEVHLEFLSPHADLRIGWTRVVWGRLDEFQPTDVVNPLDVTRFFLEGRSEARMPVGMIRGRLLPSDQFTVEAIYVPFFRRGRFDQLDEPSSPFNLAKDVRVTPNEPPRTAENGQGGVRASMTTGRVDWAVSAYRGFVPLPEYEVQGFTVIERFPRFTMIGGDFETVRGAWGLRGEVAVRDDLVEGGVGVDRRAGAYRVSGNVIVGDAEGDAQTTLVGAVDRSFARETRQLRAFAAYNVSDSSVFARVILSFNLRDNVMLESSGGLFAGSGSDVLGLLTSRDFLYLRFKVFF
jgi:hypothetical protein